MVHDHHDGLLQLISCAVQGEARSQCLPRQRLDKDLDSRQIWVQERRNNCKGQTRVTAALEPAAAVPCSCRCAWTASRASQSCCRRVPPRLPTLTSVRLTLHARLRSCAAELQQGTRPHYHHRAARKYPINSTEMHRKNHGCFWCQILHKSCCPPPVNHPGFMPEERNLKQHVSWMMRDSTGNQGCNSGANQGAIHG